MKAGGKDMAGGVGAGRSAGARAGAQVRIVLGPTADGEGVIRGYASLFGVADLSGDAVEPGAFRASVARRGAAGIRMLWQHEPGRPIGVWTSVAEDRNGLFVEGRLALSTAGGREAFALIEAGAVDGLSIGFRTRRERRGGAGEAARRRLVEVDLWEISVVTFPMQERARVLEVRRDGGGGAFVPAALGGREAGRIAAAALGLGPVDRPARPRQGVG